MNEIVYNLIKAFYEITQKNEKTGKTALGLSIIIEAGIEGFNLQKNSGSYTTSNHLVTKIADAFRDMVNQEWIKEESIDDSRKRDYYREFKDYILECGLTYTTNTDAILKELSNFDWPFADNWFFYLRKGKI